MYLLMPCIPSTFNFIRCLQPSFFMYQNCHCYHHRTIQIITISRKQHWNIIKFNGPKIQVGSLFGLYYTLFFLKLPKIQHRKVLNKTSNLTTSRQAKGGKWIGQKESLKLKDFCKVNKLRFQVSYYSSLFASCVKGKK